MPQSLDCIHCVALSRTLQPNVTRMLGTYFKMQVYHSEIENNCLMVLQIKKEIPPMLLHSATQRATREAEKWQYEMMKEYGLTKTQAEYLTIQ